MTDEFANNPSEPIEQSEDLVRIKRAYQIACMNLAELGDHRTRLVNALEAAIMLIDNLLAQMRANDIEPAPQIVAFKAGFDQGMRALLGHDVGQDEKPQDPRD